ncbi:MAG: tetratricopeptide repeat protein [Algicola sp.]|nr:tetratricopeptide repeat protein [Algicola sp.]
MREQIIQVEQLFEKKKYKKALLLLKKINKKQASYISINLAASCYFYDKKYTQANLYFVRALTLAANDSDKIEMLINLANTQLKLNNFSQAIEHYIALLEIDGSIATAKQRAALCSIASSQQNHQIIIEYAPKLLMLIEYADAALYLLVQTNLLMPDNEKNIDFYLTKLNGQMTTFNSSTALLFLELAQTCENQTYINKLVDVVGKKFSDEKWFRDFLAAQDCSKQNKPSDVIDMPKERVVGGNSELVGLVIELLKHNELLGAKFHPNLRIVETKGELCVKIYHQTNKTEMLLDIPLKCMPLLSDFNFELDAKDNLVVTPISQPINPDGINTMLLLQKIYNSSNKISHWRKTFPFITLQAFPQFLKKLAAGKPRSSKIQSFCQLLDGQQFDELTIKSFLGSREFVYKQQALKQNGIVSTKESETGLLSIIDFLNHKIGSNRYISDNGKIAVSGLACQTTQELFVQYNHYDPLLTYLIYGFVDLDSPYIFSVPIDLTLFNGDKIEVFGNTTIIKEDLVPDDLKYLRVYLPEIATKPDGLVQVDKIVIPNTNESHLLREVLTVMLNTINTEGIYANEQAVAQEVLRLEIQIIAKNMAYWQDVQVLLDSAKLKSTAQSHLALQDVQQLIQFFKSHYQKYSAKFGISMF